MLLFRFLNIWFFLMFCLFTIFRIKDFSHLWSVSCEQDRKKPEQQLTKFTVCRPIWGSSHYTHAPPTVTVSLSLYLSHTLGLFYHQTWTRTWTMSWDLGWALSTKLDLWPLTSDLWPLGLGFYLSQSQMWLWSYLSAAAPCWSHNRKSVCLKYLFISPWSPGPDSDREPAMAECTWTSWPPPVPAGPDWFLLVLLWMMMMSDPQPAGTNHHQAWETQVEKHWLAASEYFVTFDLLWPLTLSPELK